MLATRHPFLALAADLGFVLLFVLIGRASHDENPIAGTLVTLWPFAVGTLLGWVAARAWRAPLAIIPTGLVVWGATVVGGILLRAVSGQGVQVSFVIVTAIVLAAFLLGWRGVAGLVQRRRLRLDQTRRGSSPAESTSPST